MERCFCKSLHVLPNSAIRSWKPRFSKTSVCFLQNLSWLNALLIAPNLSCSRTNKNSNYIAMKNQNTKFHAFHIPLDRRRFLKSLALASAGFTLPGYLAEALTYAPEVTQGPYYPLANNIPLDKDNDLIYLNDNLTRATGLITYVAGRVLDANGNPVKGALVELWHCDAPATNTTGSQC